MTLDVEAARRAVKPSSCDPADAFDRRRRGATGGLGGIERAVGDFEQLAGAVAMFGPIGGADARPDTDRTPVDAVGRRQGGEDMVGERGAQQRRARRHEDGEFVAALTRDDRVVSAGAAQAVGELAKHAVADRVAVPVVDRLEPVEVEQRDREPAGAVGPGDLLVEPEVEFAAVGEAGERVGVGELAHLALQFEQVDHLPVLLDDHAQQEQRRDDEAGARRDFGRIARGQHQRRHRREPDAEVEEGREADRRQAVSGRERPHRHDHRIIAVRLGRRGEPVGHRPQAAHRAGDARHPARFADDAPRPARAHPAAAIVAQEKEAEHADDGEGDRKTDADHRMHGIDPGVDGGRRRRREHQEQHRRQRLDAIGAQHRDIVPNRIRNRRKEARLQRVIDPRHGGGIARPGKAGVKE